MRHRIEQLKKLKGFVNSRQEIAKKLNEGLKHLYGLKIPYLAEGNTHAYYVYALTLEIDKLGVKRDLLVKALKFEGVEGLYPGYALLHRLPLYKNKIAYGKGGFPWSSNLNTRSFNYANGICPVAEEMHDEKFLGYGLCLFKLENKDVDLIIKAFHKVWNNLDQLRNI